jgi:hypothetical protein
MTLTWGVVAAVLFGALLHASWNALVKSSTDKALDTALIHLMGSIASPCPGGLVWAGRRRRPGPTSLRPRSSTSGITSRSPAPTSTATWA